MTHQIKILNHQDMLTDIISFRIQFNIAIIIIKYYLFVKMRMSRITSNDYNNYALNYRDHHNHHSEFLVINANT